VPYVFALVDLDEGVRVVTMITGCDPDAVAPGLRVQAVVDVAPDDDGARPLVFFAPITVDAPVQPRRWGSAE
jgi:uncharacterized OB-fold protein